MTVKKILSLLGIVALASLILVACGNKQSDEKTLKVGVMTLDDTTQPVWDKVKEKMEKEGYTVEFVEFTDYNQPNKALANGEVDVNAYQHYNFLNNWNKQNNGDLVAVGDTLISPIRLFSGLEDGKAKYTDVKDIPDGATIAIPNDPTNESRSLYLLQRAGLIELSVSGDELATLKDIKTNKKNLDIKEVAAEQIASNLESVDAAVINNSYAQTAKVDYKTTLLVEEVNSDSKQWVNFIAAQKDWKKSDKADAIKALVKAYQSDDVAKIISDASNGADQPAWKGAPTSASTDQ